MADERDRLEHELELARETVVERDRTIGKLHQLAAELSPLKPRLTKSSASVVVEAVLEDSEAVLLRFERVTKPMANAWSNEADALRKYVQDHIEPGQHGRCILEKNTGEAQCYPNADGKQYLMHGLISTAERIKAGRRIIILDGDEGIGSMEALLDAILHRMQNGKAECLAWMGDLFVGTGTAVDNDTLYSETAPIKCKITVLPETTLKEG